jgi:hypothetical protein
MAALIRLGDPSLIIWTHQRSLDVEPERHRHVGDSANDPSKSGDRGRSPAAHR